MGRKGHKRCRWWIDENDQLRVGRLIVAVLAVVLAVGYVFACGVAQSLDAQRDHGWFELWAYRFPQDGAWFDVARTTATLVAIPGAAVALVIAFARHRVSQQQVAHAIGESRLVHEREIERQKSVDRQLEHTAKESQALERRESDRRVNEQYVQAVDQLRDDSAVARIAGMHALDRLAQEQAELRAIVVDVWCAYLRIRRPSDSDRLEPDEREVRATCTRLLLGHLLPDTGTRHWRGDDAIQIDLAGADLTAHWDAAGRRFPAGTSFAGAIFANWSDFSRARFADGVVFIGARLGEHAQFDGAVFGEYAAFHSAKFGFRASFGGAKFGDLASFSHAEFEYAQFARAEFAGSPSFDQAKFGGDVRFDGAIFENEPDFDGVTFGAAVRFNGASHERRGDGTWRRRERSGSGATSASDEGARS